MHRCRMLQFEGRSYRLKEAARKLAVKPASEGQSGRPALGEFGWPKVGEFEVAIRESEFAPRERGHQILLARGVDCAYTKDQ